jgi:hypothetical protein
MPLAVIMKMKGGMNLPLWLVFVRFSKGAASAEAALLLCSSGYVMHTEIIFLIAIS